MGQATETREDVTASEYGVPCEGCPAFWTWTFKGVRFLGFPAYGNVGVVDEAGNHYGAWMSVGRFRAVQAGKVDGMNGKPLGKTRIGRIA